MVVSHLLVATATLLVSALNDYKIDKAQIDHSCIADAEACREMSSMISKSVHGRAAFNKFWGLARTCSGCSVGCVPYAQVWVNLDEEGFCGSSQGFTISLPEMEGFYLRPRISFGDHQRLRQSGCRLEAVMDTGSYEQCGLSSSSGQKIFPVWNEQGVVNLIQSPKVSGTLRVRFTDCSQPINVHGLKPRILMENVDSCYDGTATPTTTTLKPTSKTTRSTTRKTTLSTTTKPTTSTTTTTTTTTTKPTTSTTTTTTKPTTSTSTTTKPEPTRNFRTTAVPTPHYPTTLPVRSTTEYVPPGCSPHHTLIDVTTSVNSRCDPERCLTFTQSSGSTLTLSEFAQLLHDKEYCEEPIPGCVGRVKGEASFVKFDMCQVDGGLLVNTAAFNGLTLSGLIEIGVPEDSCEEIKVQTMEDAFSCPPSRDLDSEDSEKATRVGYSSADRVVKYSLGDKTLELTKALYIKPKREDGCTFNIKRTKALSVRVDA